MEEHCPDGSITDCRTMRARVSKVPDYCRNPICRWVNKADPMTIKVSALLSVGRTIGTLTHCSAIGSTLACLEGYQSSRAEPRRIRRRCGNLVRSLVSLPLRDI